MWNVCGGRRMTEMDLGLAATVGRALRNWATPSAGRGEGGSFGRLVWEEGGWPDAEKLVSARRGLD